MLCSFISRPASFSNAGGTRAGGGCWGRPRLYRAGTAASREDRPQQDSGGTAEQAGHEMGRERGTSGSIIEWIEVAISSSPSAPRS